MHGSHFAEIPMEGFVLLSTMVPFDPSNSILQICSDRIVIPESNQNVRPLKNDQGRIHEKLVSAIDQTVSLRRSDAHKLDRDICSTFLYRNRNFVIYCI